MRHRLGESSEHTCACMTVMLDSYLDGFRYDSRAGDTDGGDEAEEDRELHDDVDVEFGVVVRGER